MIKLIKGVNDLATVCPDIASEWSDRNPNNPDSVSKGSNKKVWWKCALGHEWLIQPGHRTKQNGTGCPYCAGRRTIVGETDLATTHPHLATQWSTKNHIKITEVSFSSNKKILWECKLGHEWEVSPNSRTNKNKKETDCPTCVGSRVLSGFNDLGSINPEISRQWDDSNALDFNSVSPGSNYVAAWKCQDGHTWYASVKDRTRTDGRSTDCPQCYGSVSKKETELHTYIKSLLPGTEIITNTRKIIRPYELDIYTPEKKIAIEYNGLFWHTEYMGKDKNYHKTKHDLCAAQGIQLLQIWEDDWENRRNVVHKMLVHKLGASTQRTVYARNTKVKSISHTQSSKFLDENHIQGSAVGSYYLGLFTNSDELCAVMVLKRHKDTLTLERYATSLSVVGGHSKLISYVQKNIDYAQIVTFADLSVSDGSLYEATGWTLDKIIPPDYSYLVGQSRVHKFNYRLKRFRDDPNLQFEEGLTEKQLAELNGLHRIWDSGKIRYTLKKENT